MYRAGRYGEPDAALCPGPENDDFADAFYELFCKAADLCVFHSGIFPETRGTCDDCTVFWRNCDRDFDGTFHAWDAVSGRSGSLCHGAAKLSDAGSQKCWTFALGQGKGFSAAGLYRYFHGNAGDLVFADL